MIKQILIIVMCSIASLGMSQVQELETPGGAKLLIEEEPGNAAAQLPPSVSLRATYDNGNTTYFTLDGIDGIQMFPFMAQEGSTQIRHDGFRLLDFNGDERISLMFVAGRSRVSTQEVEILGGSDLSEYFKVEKDEKSKVEPGLLVSITGENGTLAITEEKRDKKVVGIVSGANGIETGLMMGQKGSIADGDTPIALTGRTYVYATTENGAIAPGDFLTSSSIPGYAMKVKKHRKAQGAIVGKAMTSLKEGDGFVLVLINLQ